MNNSNDNAQLSALILESIMSSIPGHVFWKDVNGVYLGCNDIQARSAGFQRSQDMIGKTDFDMLWAEGANEIRANDQRIMLTGTAEVVDEEADYGNGNVRMFSSIKSPIKNAQGEVFGILGICVDITNKKQLERAEKEREIAQKNAEVMNILAASLAHEIRTPLAIIKINTDLISMPNLVAQLPDKEDKKQLTKSIGNIQQAIKECTQVMDMLLVKLRQMAQLEKGAMLWETCSMKETIDAALSEYPFRDDEKPLIHYKKKRKDFVYAGHTRLTKHIIFNLLKNALYVMRDEGKGEIFIEYRMGKEYNQLIFKDTAKGIPAEYLPKIFDKFETTDDAHSGTGLGLAFCKLVMDTYGGKIECISKEGEFTQFILSFPVQNFSADNS